MLPSAMNNLPQMAHVLTDWEQDLLIKTVTKTTVNFQPVEVVKVDDFRAVVQPTEKTNLNKDTLDWTRDNITLHSREKVKFNQLVEYKGRDFRIVQVQDWSDYGYFEAIAEETKQPLKVATDD